MQTQAIGHEAALVSREHCALLLRSFLATMRLHSSSGIRMPEQYRTLVTVLASVANGDSGHPDVRSEAASAVSWHADEIGTADAAQLLATSREHANRLARAGHLGPTRKVGNRRLISKIEVEAYLASRPEGSPQR